MFNRKSINTFTLILITLTLFAIGLACSEKADEADSTVVTDSAATADSLAAAADAHLAEIALPPDSPEEFQRKVSEIYSWVPEQSDRLEYPLRDVTRIIMFSELGLGEQLEATLPHTSQAWPVGASLRLKLDDDKTAVAMRFHIDTLPGPRVRGEGLLGVFAVHSDTVFGHQVELPRTVTGTGRLDVLYRFERLMAQNNCCEMPPTFQLGSFGTMRDTLILILTFDRTRAKYLTTIIGPLNGRSYPGRSYCQFRTERGEYHKDQDEYPYVYQCADPGYVNLFLGSRWRGKKTSLEPVLTARIF